MSKYANKKDRFVSIQIVAIYILSILIAVMATAVSQRVKYEKRIEEINTVHESDLVTLRAELKKNYESQITELKQYYEYGGDVSQIEREAEYVAKVIYGTAQNHADSDKKAVVWCILNRVEHHSHPNSIIDVCEQPKQWMGYSSDNPVLADIYDLALEELKTWYSGGHRPVSNEYIYLTWSSKEILLRDTFEENRSTNYWRMR
jgi:hypothetical protein